MKAVKEQRVSVIDAGVKAGLLQNFVPGSGCCRQAAVTSASPVGGYLQLHFFPLHRTRMKHTDIEYIGVS